MTQVLILDSRDAHRAIYGQLAASLGRHVAVQSFCQSSAALGWLKENRADLIVADVDAPKLDGDAFMAQLRLLPGAQGAPILIISANGDRQQRLRALENGATDVLRAPLDHSEFIARARNLMALGRAADGAPEPARTEADPAVGAGLAEPEALFADCGPAGYAVHVVEVTTRGAAPDLAPLLRGLLRNRDRVARLDKARYAIFQGAAARAVEARALARRLRGAVALREGARQMRLGMALPVDNGPPEENAAACLRAALGDLRVVWRADAGAAPREEFRLAPIVDLGGGALVAAEWRRDGAMAEAGDADSLRKALDGTARLRAAGRQNFRALMQLRLAGEGAEAAILRVTAAIAPWAGGAPLDLAVPAADLTADFATATRHAKALRALNLGLIIDLGAPSATSLKLLAPLLAQALQQGWCDTLRFACPEAGALGLVTALRDNLARDAGAAPALRAAEVASPALLPVLLRAGLVWAQGPCLGAPLALESLIGWRAAGAEKPQNLPA